LLPIYIVAGHTIAYDFGSQRASQTLRLARTLATSVSADFSATEARLHARSSALRRELGYLDLVFASILLVVILDFFGTAVKAGPAHVVLWLFAILLFFIPQAFVVAHVNRLMPLEGGLYEWTRLAFNEGVGFLVAWNLWLYVVLYVASIGLVTVNYLAYAVGPSFSLPPSL